MFCKKEECINYVKNIDWKAIFNRAKNLLSNPNTTWNEIGAEEIDAKDFYKKYLLPPFVILLIVNVICWLLGAYTLKTPFGGSIEMGLGSVFAISLSMIISSFVSALILYALSKVSFFEASATLNNCVKLVGSITLIMILASIFADFIKIFMSFLPSLFLLALGVYTIYLAWIGLDILLDVKNKIPYIISAIICSIVAGMIINIPLSVLHTSKTKIGNYDTDNLEKDMDKFQEKFQEKLQEMSRP